MQSPQKQIERDPSVGFMLEEYEMLRERFHSLQDEGVRRLNYYISLTSGVIGGALILGDSASMSPVAFKVVLLVALVLLASVGIDVYGFMVVRSRVIDKVERGMSRIRRYFVERDSSLADFLVYTHHDEPTSSLVTQKSGIRRTAQTVQAFTVGLAAAVAGDLVGFRPEVSVVLGMVSCALDFLVLENRAKSILRQALTQVQTDIRFPRPENHAVQGDRGQARHTLTGD